MITPKELGLWLIENDANLRIGEANEWIFGHQPEILIRLVSTNWQQVARSPHPILAAILESVQHRERTTVSAMLRGASIQTKRKRGRPRKDETKTSV